MSADDRQVARLVNDVLEQRIDRRQFFRRAAALGLSIPVASGIFAACGGGGGGGTAGEAGGGGATTGAGGGGGGGETQAAAVPDRLTIRLNGDLNNLDPALYPSSVDSQMSSGMMEGLITYKPGTLDIANQLAETFTPSSDGLSFDFKLKEGILWQKDYGEVTAEDVKYSYERIAGLTKPKLDSPYAGDWAPALKEVKVNDKYSGTIILGEPFAAVMRSTLPVGSGWVLPKKAIEERGDKFGTDPVGSGPYEFVKWTPKRDILFKKFEQYNTGFDYGGTIFPEVRYVPIDDDSAADIALETGEIDFGTISLKGIDRFGANDKFKVYKQETLNYTWIGMNMLHPKLSDIRVRKAIRLAVDVPGILDAAFEGRMTRATGIIPPNMGVGYWADAPVYDRNVDEAKALMADAGVSSLELTYTFTEDTGSKDVAQIVQANLADIGIKVSLNLVDSGTFNTLGKQERDRQLFYVGYVTEPDPSWSTVWFICKQLDVWNWMYWCDKEYDRLHFAALKELDEQKRTDMYIEMQKLWDAAAHTIWTHWPTDYFASRKGIEASIYPTSWWLPQAFKAV